MIHLSGCDHILITFDLGFLLRRPGCCGGWPWCLFQVQVFAARGSEVFVGGRRETLVSLAFCRGPGAWRERLRLMASPCPCRSVFWVYNQCTFSGVPCVSSAELISGASGTDQTSGSSDLPCYLSSTHLLSLAPSCLQQPPLPLVTHPGVYLGMTGHWSAQGWQGWGGASGSESMRVARGSASSLSSHGRGLGPRDALKKSAFPLGWPCPVGKLALRAVLSHSGGCRPRSPLRAQCAPGSICPMSSGICVLGQCRT